MILYGFIDLYIFLFYVFCFSSIVLNIHQAITGFSDMAGSQIDHAIS